MRVLYIVGGAKVAYGSERVAIEVINALSKVGVKFVVVTANEGPVNDACKEKGVENYTVPFKFYNYKKPGNTIINTVKKTVRLIQADMTDINAEKRIEQLVDMSEVDIIHSNLSRNLIGGRLSEKHKIPHIWHLQEMYQGHYGLSLLKHNQIAWMNSHSCRFIAISDVVKEGWSKAGIDINKIVRIYNGIDINKIPLRKKEIRKRERLRLIMAGELCKEKGQDILIDALKDNPALRDKIEIDFYGKGKNDFVNGIKHNCEQYEIKATFKGFCDNLTDCLYEYDIGLVCSKGEGFGLSTLEFMAAGLCVIVTRTGANEELVNDVECGFVFDRDNPSELASILQNIINNPDVIKEKGFKARERAEKEFSIDRFVSSIEEQYLKTCSEYSIT